MIGQRVQQQLKRGSFVFHNYIFGLMARSNEREVNQHDGLMSQLFR